MKFIKKTADKFNCSLPQMTPQCGERAQYAYDSDGHPREGLYLWLTSGEEEAEINLHHNV
jgi:hypothetical protein